MIRFMIVLLLIMVSNALLADSNDQSASVNVNAYIYTPMQVTNCNIDWGSLSFAKGNSGTFNRSCNLVIDYDDATTISVAFEFTQVQLLTVPIGKGTSSPAGNASWSLSLVSNVPGAVQGTKTATYTVTGTIDNILPSISGNIMGAGNIVINYN